MYKVKLSPEEALETIKLRMKYDSSKTLTENVGIVDEQGLAGNPMTGQASGGQTYGRTYRNDISYTPAPTPTPTPAPVEPKKDTVTTKAAVVSIPKELTDVKSFQDWLDKSKPGWHDKYNTLGKDVSKGYGKFGPRTGKAWSTYKDEYLKGTNTPTVTPTGNPDLEVDDKDASFDQPF